MKKITTLLAVAFLICCQTIQAQTLNEKAAKIAKDYCTNVSETFSFVEADVKAYILKAAAATEKEEEELRENTNKKLLIKVAETRAKMDSEEIVNQFKEDLMAMGTALYQISDEELKDNDSTKRDFITLIHKNLQEGEGCQFAAFTFQNVTKELFGDKSGQ